MLAAAWRGPLRAEADRLALMLTAVGIPCMLAAATGEWLLLVPREQLAAARAHLQADAEENAAATAPRAAEALPAGSVSTGLLAVAATLFFLDAAARRELFGLDWWAAGIADSTAILQGEIWRAVTALGLHAGFDHLGGNLLFGAVFLALLARETGSAVVWPVLLLSGAFGNLANAWLRGPGHLSVGASTAVFGVLGTLAVLGLLRHRRLRGLRRLAPLAGGLLLLIWLGVSGERTDMGAHLLGFLAGGLLAPGLAHLPRARLADPRLPPVAGGLSALLFALAWIAALLLAG